MTGRLIEMEIVRNGITRKEVLGVDPKADLTAIRLTIKQIVRITNSTKARVCVGSLWSGWIY